MKDIQNNYCSPKTLIYLEDKLPFKWNVEWT